MEFKGILATIGNSLKAILKGEFLLRLGITRYFGKIIYVFVLICAVIWISLMIDNTLGQVEDNKKIIKELHTTEVMKTYELERYRSRSFTRKKLEEMGSELQDPENAAIKIHE
ncbi:MAG: hypothetical protein MJY48_03080 [Bacteroidales bacterium]|nr:hypothetical protein [Bacteroidales bacterium]